MVETSYPGGQGGHGGQGGQGGQGSHQGAPAIHYPSSSWSGDTRDHNTSGATSPHHHDNPSHYGGSYSNNPKYR